MPISEYDLGVAQAATTADAFNAAAEPRRRQILDALAGGERPVNDLVQALGLSQPQVSKHLRCSGRWHLVKGRAAWASRSILVLCVHTHAPTRARGEAGGEGKRARDMRLRRPGVCGSGGRSSP